MEQIVEYKIDNLNVRLSRDIIRRELVSGGGSVTDGEVAHFMTLCYAHKLNPFLREIYLVKYGTSPAAAVVAKGGFLKKADSIPEYAGFKAGVIVITESGVVKRTNGLILPSETLVGGWAKVYITRRKPVDIEVNLSEYIARKSNGDPTKFWSNMPGTMIRKVALVQALRECFPKSYQGMYSQEEIDTSPPEDMINVTSEKTREPKRAKKSEKINAESAKIISGVIAELEEIELDSLSPKGQGYLAGLRNAGYPFKTPEEARLIGGKFTAAVGLTVEKHGEILKAIASAKTPEAVLKARTDGLKAMAEEAIEVVSPPPVEPEAAKVDSTEPMKGVAGHDSAKPGDHSTDIEELIDAATKHVLGIDPTLEGVSKEVVNIREMKNRVNCLEKLKRYGGQVRTRSNQKKKATGFKSKAVDNPPLREDIF